MKLLDPATADLGISILMASSSRLQLLI